MTTDSDRPASPSAPRFYVPDPGDGPTLALPKEESRHALRVLRLGPGDAVILFDGSNREIDGRIESIEDRRAVVRLDAPRVVDREAGAAVTLAVAVPKGRRMEDLVRATTEIGAAAVIPLFTARTVVRNRADRRGRIDRLERVVLEAAKQCGRNRLTVIGEPREFEEHLALADDHDLSLLATTEGGAVPLAETITPALRRGKILLTIGPEGGFTPDEIENAIAGGFRAVTFGRSRMRVGTAAIAGLAMVLALTGS